MIQIILVAFLVLVVYFYFINQRPKNFPPGPLSLPIIGGIYAIGKRQPYKKLIELKKKYGNIIGLDLGGYRGVVLNDYSVIRDALEMPEFNSRPRYDILAYCRGKTFPGVSWASGKNWEEQRRFMIKQFGIFGIGKKSMERLILDQLHMLYEHFDQQVGKSVLNKDLFNAVSIGALWTIINGEGSEDENHHKTMVDSIGRMLSAAPPSGGVYTFPRISKFFPKRSGWNAFVESQSMQNAIASNAISAHEKCFVNGQNNSRDYIEAFLEKIASTTDENSSFYGEVGRKNLVAQICDLFRAGTETVSVCLTWVIFLLVLYPDVQEKLQLEIDIVIARNTPPSLDDRNKLPYVEALILEVLRFAAVVPLGAPHSTSTDVDFKGFYIPKDTIIIPNFYGVLRDPQLWEDPESFNPERFLSPDRSSVLRNNPSNFVFGYGKRVCPGEALARNEIFLFITGLLQKYSFKVDPSSRKPNLEDTILGATLVPAPHSIIISKR